MDRDSKLFYPDFFNFESLGKYVTRRYLFDASVISKLKAKSASSDVTSVTAHPTSVEVVSAFLWNCYMKTFTDQSDLEKPFLLIHPLNFRGRADPSLTDESFCNFLWQAVAQCTTPADAKFKDAVSEVKRAVREIDGVFVKALQNSGYYEKLEETRKELVKGANCFALSSWYQCGLCGDDFGWRKPIWISSYVCGDSELFWPNCVTLMDTRFGYGIEAWVIIDENYVAAFEEIEDPKNNVLIYPSPLQFG